MTKFTSVFSHTFDVIIFGASYAGFAAARHLHGQGKSVLLADRKPALLWESGWAFCPNAGRSDSPEWSALFNTLQSRDAASPDFIDGAIAEALATRQLLDAQIPTLYYATALAAHLENNHGGGITALAVAVNEGVRILRAKQFIDATDTGELLAILSPTYTPPTPTRQTTNLFLRAMTWPDLPAANLPIPELPTAHATWFPSFWPNERILSLNLPGNIQNHRTAWIPALRALRAAYPAELAAAIVTHASVLPFTTYAQSPAPKLPANLATAIPAFAPSPIATLADRHALGLAAAKQILTLSSATLTTLPENFPASAIHPRELSTDIAIAGTGTGGAVAALAAAKQGLQVTAVESLPFPGGTSTGSGIHIYYFGVRGGLQEQLDQRIREIMPLFGKSSQIIGFHQDAKKCAIDQLLAEANVTVLYNTTLYAVDHKNSRITSAALATPAGPATLSAKAWIDSTGDADLAALAGAPFLMGRENDRNLHAYSQTSGRGIIHNDAPRLRMMNTDAGFVDPTSSEDLTRARLAGVAQWVQEKYTPIERPVYISPLIGIRQSRQIATDYTVTLADLAHKQTFPDAVGYTACHYDNHALDYQFESDEAMFFVWVARQWHANIGCQLPYRMILPKTFDNLYIACRSAGVSVEAHPSLRQQRDIQRLGEVAGYAAALALKNHTTSRNIPYPKLRELLEASGALKLDRTTDTSFTWQKIDASYFDEPSSENLDQWLAEIQDSAKFAPLALYHLLPHKKSAHAKIAALLSHADPAVTFRAAALLAIWSDPAAQPRLLHVIESREYGFENAPEDRRPEVDPRVVPHHIVAIALLRRCCTPDALHTFEKLAADSAFPHVARTALALTLESLAQRHNLTTGQKSLLQKILATLLVTPAPATLRNPKRWPDAPNPSPSPTDRAPVLEDFSWQLHLAVAKAESSAHLPIHKAAEIFLTDPRALVRKNFINLLQHY